MEESSGYTDRTQQTSPSYITHLGDGEDLQCDIIERASTPEPEGDVLRLVIPEFDTNTREQLLNDSQTAEQAIPEVKEVVSVQRVELNIPENGRQSVSPDHSPPNQGSQYNSPHTAKNFVTSKHFLKNQVPHSRPKAFNRQVYVVSPSSEPYLRPESRCANVTASLDRQIASPVVSPVLDNPYVRNDSGYSSRFSRENSGNSIRKIARENNKMSYLDRDLYTMQGVSNIYPSGYSTGYQTSGLQTSGYQQNMSSGYQQNTSSGYQQNTSSGFQQSTSPGYQQNMSSGYQQNTSTFQSTLSMTRAQEKEELQKINDRFTSYIQKVRHLREQSNQLDSTSFLKSAKVLEEEVANLKNLYETELENLRKQLEDATRERNSFQLQCNKYQQVTADIEARLMAETEKNRKLVDDINNVQRRMAQLETELHEAKFSPRQPQEDVQHLRREIDNLTRESETLRRRCEKEQLAWQEADERAHQLTKKLELSEQVHQQQVAELRERLENSTASILTLEGRVRDLSKTDNSMPELMKQVREAAEEELRKYQSESEEVYNRNLTSLKAQMDNDAKTIDRLNTDNSELRGAVVELKGRITSLEGQIQNLRHQKSSLDALLQQERAKSSEQIQAVDKKMREVQELLVLKMREANVSRDVHIPLKAEIEALKLILQEEERRLANPPVLSYTTMSHTSPTPITSAVSYTAPVLASGVSSYAQQNTAGGMSYVQPTAPSPPPPHATAYLQTASSEPVYIPTTGYDLGGATTQDDLDHVGAGMEGWGGTRYTYETTPSVNKLQIEPSPPTTPRPVGPVMRAKSAPDENGFCTPLMLSKAKYRFGNYQKFGKPQMVTKSVRFNRHPDQFQRAGYYSKTINTYPTKKSKFESAKTRYPKVSKSCNSNVPLVQSSLGQGKDYFDEMFRDLTRETLYTQARPKSSPSDRYPTSVYHDYNTATSSAIGDIKILEVNQEGKFVRLFNEGKQESEFGGYMIQQNVGGHPVAVYRFPPRSKFAANGTITVWSGSNDPILHQPPTDYVWKEQQKWGTGPECTTILCKPNGQAIAWTTAAHRFTKNAFEQDGPVRPSSQDIVQEDTGDMNQNDADSLTEMTVNINEPKPETIYLRREKQQPPTLSPQKHPHGVSPGKEVHPHTGQSRPLTYGNDNSSVNRQSRSQTTRPDPIQGQPYAGAAAQKMGSAPLRKYTPTSKSNIRGNGTVVNKSAGTIRVGPPSPFLTPLQQEYSSRSTSALDEGEEPRASTPPSSFMPPHKRFETGLRQIQSQHNQDFLPPMPRPPLFSAW